VTRDPISLGDYVRAAKALHPADGATARAVARMLGLDLLEAAAEALSDEPQDEQLPLRILSPIKLRPAATHQPEERQFRIRTEAAPARSNRRAARIDIQPLPLGMSEDVAPRPPLLPLFNPLWERTLLTGLFETRKPGANIDIDRMIQWASLREPVLRLPVLPRRTVSRGVQILVDAGEAMVPFARDQRRLVDRIRGAIGNDQTTTLHFRGVPQYGVDREGEFDSKPYAPPPEGVPIVLLTDFGITRTPAAFEAASIREWLAFAAMTQRAGCPLFALTPYPKPQWPKELTGAISMLEWDRVTGTGALRQLKRR
jgi:hypothetical protein